jgi:hypothetical protein
VYQLHLVVEKKTSEKVTSGNVEPTLEEGSEDDLLLVVLRRKGFARRRLLLHLRLGPLKPAVHQCLDLRLGNHRGFPHRLRIWDLTSSDRHFLAERSFGSEVH